MCLNITADEARKITQAYFSKQIDFELQCISDRIKASAEKGFNYISRSFIDFSDEETEYLITVLQNNGFYVESQVTSSLRGYYRISW